MPVALTLRWLDLKTGALPVIAGFKGAGRSCRLPVALHFFIKATSGGDQHLQNSPFLAPHL